MNLHDREILELNALCGAVVDGALTDLQRARLAELLRGSEAARRYYVRALGQSASLHRYAAEMHSEAPDRPRGGRVVWWRPAWVLAAAAACLAVFLWWKGPAAGGGQVADAQPAVQFVARVTGAKEARWSRGSVAVTPGAQIRRGEQIELISGVAELTFDSGARIVLEGAASLGVNSAWGATLRRGTLRASVPPEAIGFRVSNPAVEVIDLGTEFTMIADGKGAADVLVLKGEVEAAPRMVGEQETILLRENESRRFAVSGMSAVADTEGKFARFTQPLTLERFAATASQARWSFDEPAGNGAEAEAMGVGVELERLRMTLVDVADLSAARADSPRGRALKLDGRMSGRGYFPGMSGAGAHTVTFWVRVPEDAQLSEAYTMVAWASDLEKLSHRPVQISWNRRREEGALGALRTDFGGGSAIGTTSLRDGRWHHVAVYFCAGEELNAPVQVKQYVDGRLESSTINLGKFRAAGSPNPSLSDSLWVGRRLTGGQKYPERFRGEIDELFVTARGLEPNEIVALMKDNRLPAAAVVAR